MMTSSTRKHVQRFLVLAVVLAFVFVPMYVGRTAPGDHTEGPSSGIICTENPSATFTLSARDGYISMTDGNTIYMWSFAQGQDDFQFPGPVLCVNEGDTVTIVLHNSLPEDVSLIFPGQSNVMANGLPSRPVFTAGKITSMAPVAPKLGGTMTYTFVASQPGTYLYETGTNPAIQINMGLYGALVVRPALDAANPGRTFAYNSLDSEFSSDTEYLMLLSEIDPLLHQAIERGESFDMTTYQPRYWLINGRTFPDTLAPNFASWLPSQPYSALAHIHPYDAVKNPLPALSRYLGAGYQDYPFHPHAFNGRVIARDGRLLKGPSNEDLSFEKFSILVGPGQTWDTLFSWTDTEAFDPSINPIPVELPNEQNLTYGQWFGSPYLGNQDVVPVGTASYNQCGEFYHIAHNHALQQLVGWGVVMTGQTTFTRIDPPLPNNCPTN